MYEQPNYLYMSFTLIVTVTRLEVQSARRIEAVSEVDTWFVTDDTGAEGTRYN